MKGEDIGNGRPEYEERISDQDFERYKLLSEFWLTKKRLVENHPTLPNLKIEFDMFCDNNLAWINNLVFAEIEVNSKDIFQQLPLLGKDITDVWEYNNIGLAKLNSRE